MQDKNIGSRDGTEVVQLYVNDVIASVKEDGALLKKFKKIFLKKGESKQITFYIKEEDLSFYNYEMKEVVEKGDFEILIGQSFSNIKLKGIFSLFF